VAGALISRPTSWTKSRSVQKILLRKVAESDRTQSDCETIGILEDEDDSSNSEFRLKRNQTGWLASRWNESHLLEPTKEPNQHFLCIYPRMEAETP